jgi:hypothetical protein
MAATDQAQQPPRTARRIFPFPGVSRPCFIPYNQDSFFDVDFRHQLHFYSQLSLCPQWHRPIDADDSQTRYIPSTAIHRRRQTVHRAALRPVKTNTPVQRR